MPDVVLGSVVRSLSVRLTRDADFTSALKLEQDGQGVAYPAGATLALSFDNGVTWPATIVNDTASWDVDKVQVNSLIASGAARVRLQYTEGSADATWAKGGVQRG